MRSALVGHFFAIPSSFIFFKISPSTFVRTHRIRNTKTFACCFYANFHNPHKMKDACSRAPQSHTFCRLIEFKNSLCAKLAIEVLPEKRMLRRKIGNFRIVKSK